MRRDARTPEAVAAYVKARETVFARARGRCEGCSRKLYLASMEAQHRLPRSAGRNDDPSNLLALCGPCHNDCHSRPAWAREVGWVISRYDARPPHQVPVLLAGRWFLLPEGGGFPTLTMKTSQPTSGGQ